MQAQKTVGQDSAFDVGTELAFYEVRHRVIAITGPREKRLEVLAHRLVKQRFFGATWGVAGRGFMRMRGRAIACRGCLRHPAEAVVRSSCHC